MTASAPVLAAAVSSNTLVAVVDRRGRHRREALRARISLLLATLGRAAEPDAPTRTLLDALVATLAGAPVESMWLTLSVLRGQLPGSAAVVAAHRRARTDGPLLVLAGALLTARRPGRPRRPGPWPTVDVVTGGVLIDLHHTARTRLATGIQRVARLTSARWERDHAVTLVGWTPDLRSLRRLAEDERANALHGGQQSLGEPDPDAGVVIPWHSTYVLPELLTEPARARALQAMLQFSHTLGAMIGFDCVPITAAETISPDMGGNFALMLSAIAHGRSIAAISDSAATEYAGWRSMLPGSGLAGPRVRSIRLPAEVPSASAESSAQVRHALGVDARPLVLCVGSHEPRKNHLAVLHAAELLWRRGDDFTLVFVGGNAWASSEFEGEVAAMQTAGRPVRTLRALPDELLFDAYRTARCTVFPSLIEGFGLPVAESLACGTPVITSNYGSMLELADSGGTTLVDPRDDHSIADALHHLLIDDDLHARLAGEAAARPVRTWDDYARETWTYLTDEAR